MTSTADMTQHPDVSEISDLHEGLLPPSRTADVRQHLDSCELCADVHASLSEIRDLLGTLPGPVRMPADIAGRIDAALAAEALLDATAPAGAAVPVGAGAPVRAAAPDDGAHVSRETSPGSPSAEAPASDRPTGHSRAATGPGRPRTPRRRRRVVLGAVFGAAAIGMGALLVQGIHSGGGNHAVAEKGARTQQGAVFSTSSLPHQVQTLLAARPTTESAKTAPSQNAPADKESGFGVKSGPPKLEVTVPPCVQAGTGRTSDAPLAAETGEYQGTRAYLLVLPHATDSTQVQAYVVDASCETQAPNAKGKLLLTHAYPLR
ncbi:anti-sigma factor [Streptomyces sp. NPDC059070]|uniref:anti-sigma factor family protein n=1 Tax=unclassified Streptomyces TaxID=2593676 RepID=UPI0034E1C39C